MNNRKNIFIGLVFIILLLITCINYNFKTRAVDLLDEEIIISNVCFDDDFASNTIIIVLKHNVSLEFIDYTTDNFNEIECIGVKELSEYTTEIIKMQIEADMTGDYSKLKERIEYNTLLDIALYHRILRLTIGNPSKENVINSIRILEKRNDIISAEPDYSGFEETVPDDYYYIDGNQWGLSGSFGINADKAWNYTTGSLDILVGVIDSGIDVSHPDLVNNINNGLHRDYVNHPSGVDYVDVSKANLVDSRGHGTCVSGVIGAQGNNDEGIAGVCWNTKLVSLKVIDE